MKFSSPLIGMALLVALAGTPRAQDAPDAQTFAATAASSNALEIQSSQLALETLPAGDARDFADLMVADHTLAAQKLVAAAQADDIMVSSDLQPKHAAEFDKLKAADPQAFPDAYITMQVAAHDEAVALFETYASSGPNGNLKTFAIAALPTLQNHQQVVQGVAGN